MLLFAEAEESAKRHNRVRYLATQLIDHQSLDRSDFVPVGSYTVVPSTRSLSIKGFPVLTEDDSLAIASLHSVCDFWPVGARRSTGASHR